MFFLIVIICVIVFFITEHLLANYNKRKKLVIITSIVNDCNKSQNVDNLDYEKYREDVNGITINYSQNCFIRLEKDSFKYDDYDEKFPIFYLRLEKVTAKHNNTEIIVSIIYWNMRISPPFIWEKKTKEIVFGNKFIENAKVLCQNLNKMILIVKKEAEKRHMSLEPTNKEDNNISSEIFVSKTRPTNINNKMDIQNSTYTAITKKEKDISSKTINIKLQWTNENYIQDNLHNNKNRKSEISILQNKHIMVTTRGAFRDCERGIFYVVDDENRCLGYLPKSLEVKFDEETLCNATGSVYKIFKQDGFSKYSCFISLDVPVIEELEYNMHYEDNLINKKVPFLEKVVFLDYQIANSQNELCRISAIITENGKIKNIIDELIKPINSFDYTFSLIEEQKVSEKDVYNKSNLKSVWKKFFNFNTDEYCFILHNATLKLQNLLGNFANYGIKPAKPIKYISEGDHFSYIDIYKLSQEYYSDIHDLSQKGLSTFFGIQHKGEYDSMQNVVNCLKIFCCILKNCYIDINYQCQDLSFHENYFKKLTTTPYHVIYPNKEFNIQDISFETDINSIQTLSDKTICVTGEFKRYPNNIEIPFYHGINVKRVSNKITKSVDILVVGENFSKTILQQANDYKKIKIINEDLFYQLIDIEYNAETLKKEKFKLNLNSLINGLPKYNLTYKKPIQMNFTKEVLSNFTINQLSKSLNNYVIIHIATTGLNDDDEIIELCAIKYNNNLPIQKFQTYVKPKLKTIGMSEKYNGINFGMLQDAPNIEDIIEDFLSFVENNDIVGYNTQFIIKFLNKNGFHKLFSTNTNIYDVLLNIKELHRYTFPKLDLTTICDYYKIYFDNNTISKCFVIGLLLNSITE